jgi:serine/threonine protein kinase
VVTENNYHSALPEPMRSLAWLGLLGVVLCREFVLELRVAQLSSLPEPRAATGEGLPWSDASVAADTCPVLGNEEGSGVVELLSREDIQAINVPLELHGLVVRPASDVAGRARHSWNQGAGIGRGSLGEVWRARLVGGTGWYVLKRIFLAKEQQGARMAAYREEAFNRRLAGIKGVARFVECFWADERDGVVSTTANRGGCGDEREGGDLWLVYRDEGTSLSAVLYKVDSGGMRTPSSFWTMLHADTSGVGILRQIWEQLLQVTAAAHARGVLHRDIKPGNILLKANATGHLIVTLADWSSAVDLHRIHAGYDKRAGPTVLEATEEYAAPEVRLSDGSVPFRLSFPEAYDAWSIGATILEIVLGESPAEVFSPSPAEIRAAIRSKRLERAADPRSRYLHALELFCLWGRRTFPQVSEGSSNENAPCPSEGGFRAYLRRRVASKFGTAPSGRAVPLLGKWGEDLLFWMLLMNPADRLGVVDAQQHPYFHRQIKLMV